jgi:foldase protein PrsA
LIECNLIEQEAKKNGVDATPEEIKARLEKEVDRRFEQIMTRFRIKNVSELAEFIKRNGGNIDSVRKRFTTEVAPGVRPAILEDKLLRMRVTVTPEEVRDRYQKLYGPRLEAQQIVVATKKEADDLVAKIRAGADFAILAREQSLDTASRGSGGKMQTLSSDSELGRAMANLKEGEVSDPVPIGDLYHILKLNKRIGSETVKFSDIEAKLKDEIANENMEKLRSSWRAALKDKADIRILNPLN